MKLPVQPPQYDRSMEQARSGILEREVNLKLNDAPVDDSAYLRKNGAWVKLTDELTSLGLLP